MGRNALDTRVVFGNMGLSAFTFETTAGYEYPADQGLRHTHMELEMVLVEKGTYALDVAGRHEEIKPGELACYWAGLPHLGCGKAIGALYHVAQVPLVQILPLNSFAPIIDRLLSGSVVHTQASAADGPLFARWSTELTTEEAELRDIVQLEMHARLRRCFRSVARAGQTPAGRSTTATAAGVASAIRYVMGHFVEHITVHDIAHAVGWNRYHLMDSFHQICGLTVWDYVIRVRLAEAQRLLTVTDLPTMAVCHRAGFSSVSRMYDAFRRYCNATPSEYRTAARG